MSRRSVSCTAAVLLVLISGCLPYSCRRDEPSALFPSDSLSREVASGVAVDTLDLAWSRSRADRDLIHPRTVRFGPRGTLYASDVEQGILVEFDMDGRWLRTVETVDVPYLAGTRGDTVAVFDPSTPALHFLVDGERVAAVSIDDADRPRSALVYGALHGAVYYKRVDSRSESFIAEVDRDGSIRSRFPLPGPTWRHAGLLRPWGDSLLSLSGFRPVVDVLTGRDTIDTLALRGFDSPMLARSRAFVMGDVHEAPLLTSSAAAAGDHLFVLNLRAGWLRIDVFDRSGRLVHRLTEREADYRSDFFPQDLDVRRLEDGAYAVAVVFSRPEPSLRLYTWRPNPPET